MRLVILGILMEGERHPYDIRQTMKERAMHYYIKYQDGSLYYAIDQLHKAGFVEALEVVRDTSRPEKTIYAITDSGKVEFEKLLMQQFENDKPIFDPIYAALSFSSYGDPAKIIDVLRQKVRDQESYMDRMKQVYESHVGIEPRAVLYMMTGRYETGMARLRWLRKLLHDAEAGLLQEVGTRLLIDEREE
ncbi:PadR family transcriptional regulator [Paenibacillus sp. N1-5-1-14]|uniref:PadR family transcriptional regulator n=1 Tax=Paenibacillus radicibacter TaxID=2972488 RepID=UPI002158F5F8|nr:PadR family transcriptional regulator [Paenibacillus radicibacter]MCR8645232.1 PadR family transcriptional regulator [Paenibacillus radicibacter]